MKAARPDSSIAFAAALLGLSLAACTVGKPPLSGAASASAAAPVRPSLSARAPDAFYEPPANVPERPGSLLRSEPLRNITLPPGMQGWRILYTTTVDDRTPATAVATVFAPAVLPAGPRPVVTWEHGTTGVLQKCMPSLVSAPTEGIPARDRIVAAGWVVVATDYSFAEKGGPHPYLLGEGEARAALDSVRAARRMPSSNSTRARWCGVIRRAARRPSGPASSAHAMHPTSRSSASQRSRRPQTSRASSR